MSQNSNPLVSIIVITYNSAKFVLETLESAKNQTYQNIELIISDDGSKDETVTVCGEWLKENEVRFVRSELITVEKNTGIPANCNRGIKVAQGEWIKLIAGDDLLSEKCINSFVEFSRVNLVNFFVSPTIEFVGCFEKPSKKWTSNLAPDFLKLNTSQGQFKYFLRGNTYLPGCAFFIKKSYLNDIGGFLENYPLVEDRPLLLNWTYNGFFIGTLNEALVNHRRHEHGLTSSITFPNYLLDVYRAIFCYAKKSKKLFYVINSIWHLGFLRLEKRYFNTKLYKTINLYRIKFQPLRILWFQRNFLK